ncbi:MAG: hypothetical protein RR565_01760 [Erysipelothrix sp.]
MYIYSNKELINNIDAKTLWSKYKQVELWNEWDPSIIDSNLNGDFSVGTKGTFKNEGFPPLEFELTEVIEGKSFTNQSQIGPFTISFTHLISEVDSKLSVEHGLSVAGPDENQVNEIGSNIAKTIPVAMKNLLGIDQ